MATTIGKFTNGGDPPQTQQASSQLLALPSFPQADRALLDQYVAAFRKVLVSAVSATTSRR